MTYDEAMKTAGKGEGIARSLWWSNDGYRSVIQPGEEPTNLESGRPWKPGEDELAADDWVVVPATSDSLATPSASEVPRNTPSLEERVAALEAEVRVLKAASTGT